MCITDATYMMGIEESIERGESRVTISILSLGRTTMIRVAFIGQQRSGKDTAAGMFDVWIGKQRPDIYADKYAYHYSFAQPIKDLCEASYGMHTREDMQGIGAHLRQYDKAFFVRILERKIIEDNPQFAVITDVRYPNEVAAVTKLGFHLLGIDAPDEERWIRSGEAAENWEEYELHESEVNARASLLNAPSIVKNHGTKEEFKDLLEAYFEEIQ